MSCWGGRDIAGSDNDLEVICEESDGKKRRNEIRKGQGVNRETTIDGGRGLCAKETI